MESKLRKLVAQWEHKLQDASDLYNGLKKLDTQDLHAHEDATEPDDKAHDMNSAVAITNLDLASLKTHLALVYGSDIHKGDWVTRCRWRFGSCPHEAASASLEYKKRCKHCWSIFL